MVLAVVFQLSTANCCSAAINMDSWYIGGASADPEGQVERWRTLSDRQGAQAGSANAGHLSLLMQAI